MKGAKELRSSVRNSWDLWVISGLYNVFAVEIIQVEI